MKMDYLKKKAPIRLLAAFGIICLFLSACATLPKPLAATQAPTPLDLPSATSTNLASTPDQRIVVHSDYITAFSFQDLARKSPLIVIGHVTEIGEVINAGLDGNDETRPSPYNFYIGQIYKFQIEQFLKGQGDLSDNATINILVFESIIDTPAASITQADIDQWRAMQGCDPRCQPMYPGTRYLLFLKFADDYLKQSHQYYILPIHPWMFPLTNPDFVMAEDPWGSVDHYFPPQPLADILWQVENPDIPYVRPTPTRFLYTPVPVPDMPTPANPYPNP
jgi:hypothetical protein